MPCRYVTRFIDEQESLKMAVFSAFIAEHTNTSTNTAVPPMQGNRSLRAAVFALYVGHSCPTALLLA